MASIYDVSAFSSSNSYVKNNIVLYNGYYRYALIDKESGDPFVEANWGGIISDPITGRTQPYFFWTPNYGGSTQWEPKVKVHKFGDGYEQRLSDNINNDLLMIDYLFDGLTDIESMAIAHFFYARGGVESFLFKPHKAYAKIKRFIVRNYNDNSIFYNKNSIKVRFEEVSN